MFSLHEIERLIAVYADYDVSQERLRPLCDEVATNLGFDYATDISLDADTVDFIVWWHGPYQSENKEWFHFPTAMLNCEAAEIAHHIRINK